MRRPGRVGVADPSAAQLSTPPAGRSAASSLAFAAGGLGAWALDASGLLPASGLAWDREALASGQLWRAFTGHLVHWSTLQAWLDLAVTVALMATLERTWGSRTTALAALGAMPLLSLALWIGAPGLAEYRGASGVAVAAAWALGWEGWFARPAWRPGLSVLIAMGLGKLVLDAQGAAAGLTGLPQDVQVAWQAHAAGAALGTGFAWARHARAGGRHGA